MANTIAETQVVVQAFHFSLGSIGAPGSHPSGASMPLDMPGSLGLQATADLTAAILAANGYPAGDAELPSSNAAQQALTIDPAK